MIGPPTTLGACPELAAAERTLVEFRRDLMRRGPAHGCARRALWWAVLELADIIETMKQDCSELDQAVVVARLDAVMAVAEALRRLAGTGR